MEERREKGKEGGKGKEREREFTRAEKKEKKRTFCENPMNLAERDDIN